MDTHVFEMKSKKCWGALVIEAENEEEAMKKMRKFMEGTTMWEKNFIYQGTLKDAGGCWHTWDCA